MIVRDSKRVACEEYLTFEYVKTYMNDALWIDCGPKAANKKNRRAPLLALPATRSKGRQELPRKVS